MRIEKELENNDQAVFSSQKSQGKTNSDYLFKKNEKNKEPNKQNNSIMNQNAEKPLTLMDSNFNEKIMKLL